MPQYKFYSFSRFSKSSYAFFNFTLRDWLVYKSTHANLETLLSDVFRYIGRACNYLRDRQSYFILIVEFDYFLSSFDSVHYWHVNIHENESEVFATIAL